MTTPVRSDPSRPPAEARKPWVAPVVQTMVAGEAEVGTRAARGDGTFTTS